MESSLLDTYKYKPFNSIHKDFFSRKIGTRAGQTRLLKSIMPDYLLETFECAKDDKYLLYSEDFQESPAYQCRFCPEESQTNMALVAKEDGGVLVINTELSGSKGVVQNFRAHKNCIFDTQWMGRQHIVTSSGDWSVKYHDLETHQTISNFSSHSGSVKALALRPNHKNMFASSSRDGSILLWDLNSPKSHLSLEPESMPHQPWGSLFNAHHPDLPVTTEQKPKRKSSAINANIVPKPVTSIIFTSENLLASSGSSDGKIKFWDVRKISKKNPEVVKTISYSGKLNNPPGYTDLVVNRAGTTLFAYCKDRFIYQYDLESSNYSTPVVQYTGHSSTSFYLKMDLSPDENYLVCGSSSYSPYIYHVGLVPQRPVLLNGHKGEVTVCRWCPSNQGVIMTISDDCSAMVHRMRPGSEYNVFYRDQIKKDTPKPVGHHQAPLSLSSRCGEETVNAANQPCRPPPPKPEQVPINLTPKFSFPILVTPVKSKDQSITKFLSPVPSSSLFKSCLKSSPKPCCSKSPRQVLGEKNGHMQPQQTKPDRSKTVLAKKPAHTNSSPMASKKRVEMHDDNDENQLPGTSNGPVKRRRTVLSQPISQFLKTNLKK